MSWAQFFADYWWLLLIFGSTIIGIIGAALEGVRDFVVDFVTGRRAHRLEIERIRAGHAVAAPRGPEGGTPAPGPCPHRPRNVKPVFSSLGEHLAYYCAACDAQLPKSWAVLEDDL